LAPTGGRPAEWYLRGGARYDTRHPYLSEFWRVAVWGVVLSVGLLWAVWLVWAGVAPSNVTALSVIATRVALAGCSIVLLWAVVRGLQVFPVRGTADGWDNALLLSHAILACVTMLLATLLSLYAVPLTEAHGTAIRLVFVALILALATTVLAVERARARR
jgi:hypothetical protein